MKHIDLFSGIGGFSLGLERAGHETIAFCEIDPYCQKVLAKHWPNVDIHDDIRKLSYKLSSGFSGIVTAGFPCQDISCAGKREGIEGERSGLWSELARVLGELRPRYAILENVSALLSGDRGRWFGRVLGDLAEIGYDCEWHCIPASYLGAPHRRDRIWIICRHADAVRCNRDDRQERKVQNENTDTNRICQNVSYSESVLWNESRRGNGQDRPDAPEPSDNGEQESLAYADRSQRRWIRSGERPGESERNVSRESISNSSEHVADTLQRSRKSQISSRFGWRFQRCVEEAWDRSPWQFEPDVGRVANGVPARVDRLRCLGNAIVPQMAELIGNAIKDDVII